MGGAWSGTATPAASSQQTRPNSSSKSFSHSPTTSQPLRATANNKTAKNNRQHQQPQPQKVIGKKLKNSVVVAEQPLPPNSRRMEEKKLLLNNHSSSVAASGGDGVFRIGVVGGGASATSFCIQLYSKLRHQELRYPGGVVELLVFERGERVGPGLAYTIHPDGDTFRLNRSKDSMDPYAGRIGQFSAWLAEHGDEEARASDFPPRSAYGRYLVHLLDELKRVSEKAGSPLRVEYLTRTAVTDVAVVAAVAGPDGKNQKVAVATKYVIYAESEEGLREWEVDAVLLCTGHYPVPSYRQFIGLPNYASDYPGYRRLIAQVAGTNVDVGIIGSSTTMVDIATELQSRGHQGKIVSGSRMGILPNTDEPISIKVFERSPRHEDALSMRRSSCTVGVAYTNEPYVGHSAEFHALSDSSEEETTATTATPHENGDDDGNNDSNDDDDAKNNRELVRVMEEALVVEADDNDDVANRTLQTGRLLRQFIKRAECRRRKSLKIKQICGFAISNFSAGQRRTSLQRSLICTTPLVSMTPKKDDDDATPTPGATIITLGPASQTMRLAVNSLVSPQPLPPPSGDNGPATAITTTTRSGSGGNLQQHYPNLRYYSLTHLNIETLARPVRIDDVVERVFREISDLQGSPITFDDLMAMYREHSSLEIMSRAIDSARTGQVKPWQMALFTVGPLFLELWDLMSDEEKRIYYEKYNTLLFRYLGFIPLVNARKLRAMLEEGRLRVLRELEPIRVVKKEEKKEESCYETEEKPRQSEEDNDKEEVEFEMSGMEDNTHQTYRVKILLNASGVGGSPKDIPVLANMLKSGVVALHHIGGLRINRDTHQTLDANGSVNEGIYAMGEVTKGHYFISADLPTVAEQANKVAEQLAKKLFAAPTSELDEEEEEEEEESHLSTMDGSVPHPT